MNADSVSALAGDVKVYRLRDEYIPIVSLSDLFATGERRVDEAPDGSSDAHSDAHSDGSALLVVVEWADKRIALLVDDLLGQQQVVIKSLETNYERVSGLSGATILGDGTVSLILDISGLVDMSAKKDEKSSMNKGR